MVLIRNKRLNRFERQAHVQAEFLYGDELVIGFLEVVFDLVDDIPAVALTFASDALDVFGVDAKARDSWFHNALFLIALQRFNIRMKVIR